MVGVDKLIYSIFSQDVMQIIWCDQKHLFPRCSFTWLISFPHRRFPIGSYLKADMEIMVYLGIIDTIKYIGSQKILTEITAILSWILLWWEKCSFLCFGNEASRTRSVCLPIATPTCFDKSFKKVLKPYKRDCYDVMIL